MRSSFTTEPPGLTDLRERAGAVSDLPGTVQQSIELLVPGHTLFALGVPVAVGTEHPRQLR
ncbi:MAG: hypothetical protein GTO74_12515, partial [Hydrogenophaga sp.]|uniref:hypothetical protein n=1 Tax=Hydrogenophaga sp. TaxID=1904254 RepID=UPI0016AD06C8